MTPRFRNAAVVVLVSMGLANASAQIRPVVRFEHFLQQTRAARFEMYSGGPETAVRDAAAFEEMRQYILAMYQGVTVTHSFVLGTHHVDCVPIEQQPSVRLLGLKDIATPPPPFMVTSDHSIVRVSSPNSEAVPDHNVNSLGSSAVCEEHTIPMMRLTLERLARFTDLRHFLRKSPDGTSPLDEGPPDPWRHRYAITKQQVNNWGGNSTLNYWKPVVDTSKGEGFSLSQQWYVGGTGTTFPGEQTAEVGWQVFPQHYGDDNAHLFIYWTANGYNKTDVRGCYNLDCPAFVQTSPNWVLGSDCLFPPPADPGTDPCYLPNVSTLGGPQYEFTAQFNLYDNQEKKEKEWWLYLGASAGSELTPVGYYPAATIYGATGQLTQYAQAIEYGTESVSAATSKYWPPQGSGKMPSKGYSYAAYQRDMFYVDTNGVGHWDALTTYQDSPNCYQVTGPFDSDVSGWGIYFYAGGPGNPKGTGC
jgi:hypothetical protein